MDQQVTLDVKVTIDQTQVKQFVKMLQWMQLCGQVGHSSDIRVFVDGDGRFRPRFTVDGVDCKQFLGDDAFVWDYVKYDDQPSDVHFDLNFMLE